MRTIAVLGATGSIGTQALDIVRRYPDRFRADEARVRLENRVLDELARFAVGDHGCAHAGALPHDRT